MQLHFGPTGLHDCSQVREGMETARRDDSAVLTDTTYIEQDWSVGMVGLYGSSTDGTTLEFDNVEVWIDNTGGQTFDDQQIDDDFNSNVLELYDEYGARLACQEKSAIWTGFRHSRMKRSSEFRAETPPMDSYTDRCAELRRISPCVVRYGRIRLREPLR